MCVSVSVSIGRLGGVRETMSLGKVIRQARWRDNQIIPPPSSSPSPSPSPSSSPSPSYMATYRGLVQVEIGRDGIWIIAREILIALTKLIKWPTMASYPWEI